MSFSRSQVVFLAIIAALCGGIAQSQTIAKADLAQFYGKFSSKIPGNRDSIDVSRFAEWQLAPRSVGGFGAANKRIKTLSDGLWVYLDPLRQEVDLLDRRYSTDEEQNRPGTSYWLYMMTDAQGYAEGRKSVLTVWEEVGSDSVHFQCAQIGPYDCGLGMTWVEKALVLPDRSVLLYTKWDGADGGESWGSDTFLRATALCDFKPFYESSWSSSLKTKVHYDASDLRFGEYRILELTDFRSEDSAHDTGYHYEMRIDSARVRVIDLWQVAVDSFKIDTTAARR